MGMKAVRMSRKYHPIPRTYAKDMVCDKSIVPDQSTTDSVLRDRDAGPFPKKKWPNFEYPTTPTPKPHAQDGKEGPVRGRQADKSSRSK